MMLTFERFYEFTEKISDSACKYLDEVIDKTNIRFKLDGTMVTNADMQIESHIRSEIENDFPEHSICGEEKQDSIKDSEYKWIIDPIDGTFSFASGVPLFGCLIGLLRNNKPLYGSMRLPFIKNAFISGDSSKCLLNGLPVSCNEDYDPTKSLILTTDDTRLSKSKFSKLFQHLINQGSIYRTWGDCFGYYLLCTGKADLMLDLDLKPYDILPIIPIILGAGACIQELPGEKFANILAYNPKMEKFLLK